MQGIGGISGSSIGAMMCQLSDILDDPATMEKLGLSPTQLEMIVGLLEKLENLVSDGIQPEEVGVLKSISENLEGLGLGDTEVIKKIEFAIKELEESIREDGLGVPPLKDALGGMTDATQMGAVSGLSDVSGMDGLDNYNQGESFGVGGLGTNSADDLFSNNIANQISADISPEVNYFQQIINTRSYNRGVRAKGSKKETGGIYSVGGTKGALLEEKDTSKTDLYKSEHKKKEASHKQKKAIAIVEDSLTYMASALLGRLRESSAVDNLIKAVEDKIGDISGV